MTTGAGGGMEEHPRRLDKSAGGAPMKRIYVVGTADTKGEELAFLAERIRALGGDPLVVDVGTRAPAIPPEVGRDCWFGAARMARGRGSRRRGGGDGSSLRSVHHNTQ